MKSIALSAAAIFTLASCTSSQQASNAYSDDVYYSSKANKPAETVQTQQQVQQPQQDVSDQSVSNQGSSTSAENRFDYNDAGTTTQDGNTYVTNNYYSDDDYYDYAYSSRIRRFYRPMWNYGYYDSYYTNSYWYDYNPYDYGVSIYCGYNWWAPSSWWAPSFTYFSWGYTPYNYWWSSPYSYYGYGPYHHGWNNYSYGY